MFSLDILGPKTTPLCVWYKYFKWNEIEHFRQFDYHLPEHKAQHIYFHYPGKYSDAMRRQNIPSKKILQLLVANTMYCKMKLVTGSILL